MITQFPFCILLHTAEQTSRTRVQQGLLRAGQQWSPYADVTCLRTYVEKLRGSMTRCCTIVSFENTCIAFKLRT